MLPLLRKLKHFLTRPLFRATFPTPPAPPAPRQEPAAEATTQPPAPAPTVTKPEPVIQAPTLTPAHEPIEPLPTGKLPVVRTELNFEKYPIFTTSQFKGKSREIVEASTATDGSTVERRITIGKTESNVEVGVLTSTHQDLFYILQDLWEQAGHPEKTLVSLYQLTNRLKIKKSGRAYDNLKHWLGDLRQIPITWVNSFYDASTQEHTQAIYYQTVLSQLAIAKRQKGERTKAAVAYTLDEHIRRNLLARHSHPILIETALSLKTEYAKLLYPYIDRRLAHTTRFEATLKNLWQTLGLSDTYIRSPSDRKTKLGPAFRELTGKPLSTGTLADIKVERTVDGTDYKAVFFKAARAHALTPKPKQARQPRLPLTTRPKRKRVNPPDITKYLADEMVQQLGDSRSRKVYLYYAAHTPDALIFRLLSEVKAEWHEGSVDNKGAIFTLKLKQHRPDLFKKQEPPATLVTEGYSQKT